MRHSVRWSGRKAAVWTSRACHPSADCVSCWRSGDLRKEGGRRTLEQPGLTRRGERTTKAGCGSGGQQIERRNQPDEKDRQQIDRIAESVATRGRSRKLR